MEQAQAQPQTQPQQAVQVHDKTFVPYYPAAKIAARVAELGSEISADYDGKKPLIIAILNGSFIFAADLFRSLSIEAEISFIKLASYKGTSSTGAVVTAIGLDERVTGRHVLVLEDIIDTGRTLQAFLPELNNRNPASLKIATFLSKPEALLCPEIVADYVGFEIPNRFVLGYGLDYDGLGRNLGDLYQLSE